MSSRVATQAALVNLTAKKLTAQITAKVIARGLGKMEIGFALGALINQGVIEKASESANRLSIGHPKIYHKLRF